MEDWLRALFRSAMNQELREANVMSDCEWRWLIMYGMWICGHVDIWTYGHSLVARLEEYQTEPTNRCDAE